LCGGAASIVVATHGDQLAGMAERIEDLPVEQFALWRKRRKLARALDLMFAS
jgi:hypothetical protein